MDDLLSRCQEFDEAELRADVGRLESLLADDFLSIGEQGFMLDKTKWIARHGDFSYVNVESRDLDVRRYERCAVVRDVQHAQAIWQNQALTLRTRRSQVWVEQPEGWKLVAIQFSSLTASDT